MSDLISRVEAMDALAKLVPYAIYDESTECYTNGLTDAYNLICHLPSAQQWIPCSERLPEAGEVVLVYGTRGGIYTAVYNKPEPEWKCGWWKLNSKSHKCNPHAWMPLPEPPEVKHE